MPRLPRIILPLVLLVGTCAAPTHAGFFTADFNDGSLPAGTVALGTATVDSGSLLLTPAVNTQMGTLIVPLLDPGLAVQAFTANFSLALGPGSSPPADGIGFAFGPFGTSTLFGEEGPGVGLTVAFDTYDNGGGEAPAIDILVNGAIVAHGTTNPFTNGNFVPVAIRLDPDGTLDLSFNGVPVHANVPTGYVPAVGDRFGFGGRTGGANSEQRVDSITIATTVVPEPTSLALLGLGSAFVLLEARRRSALSRREPL